MYPENKQNPKQVVKSLHYVENYLSPKNRVVAQSRPSLCDPMDCSLPGCSIHGILQARVLVWVAISFSRGSSWPRDQTRISCIAGRRFTLWAPMEERTFHWATNQNYFPKESYVIPTPWLERFVYLACFITHDFKNEKWTGYSFAPTNMTCLLFKNSLKEIPWK